MKTISNTLKIEVERWSDPGGPEPNGAGSPVASHNFVSEVSGSITVELSAEDLTALRAVLAEISRIKALLAGK